MIRPATLTGIAASASSSLVLSRVLLLQFFAVVFAAEVVREGIALGALGSQLFLAQGDQGVFFLLQGLRIELLVAHVFKFSITGSLPPAIDGGLKVGLTSFTAPDFRLASRYSSMSPSSTLSQSLRLDVGAQVLDARGVKHVGADLVPPADIGLGVFQRLGRRVALLHFQLVQLGPQHFHGGVLVGVLGTFVLATDHGVGRYVGNTYGRVGGVYVLTTGTGGTIGVDPQVGRVDFDFHLVIDLRRDENRGERRVATVAGVERALAHQTVYADFGTQPAKGVFTLDVHGRAFDPGDFTGRQLHDGRVETAFVSPTQVHAQQDVGPVLGFGTAGTGLDVQVGVVRVHFVAEHAAEF